MESHMLNQSINLCSFVKQPRQTANAARTQKIEYHPYPDVASAAAR